MSVKTVYTCNICYLHYGESDLYGVVFSTGSYIVGDQSSRDFPFTLGDAKMSDVVHICKRCLKNLHSEFVKIRENATCTK